MTVFLCVCLQPIVRIEQTQRIIRYFVYFKSYITSGIVIDLYNNIALHLLSNRLIYVPKSRVNRFLFRQSNNDSFTVHARRNIELDTSIRTTIT